MAMPVKPAMTLAIIAAVLTAVLALVASFTRERITSNEQAWIRQRLDALVPPMTHDSVLLTDSIALTAPEQPASSQPGNLYLWRHKAGQVEAVPRTTATDDH